MAVQPALFRDPTPPDLRERGIDLRCCSCADEAFVELAAGARLVIADPPWRYSSKIGASQASDHYEGLSHPEIVRHLSQLRCSRMALWTTGPTEAFFDAAVEDARADFAWRWGRHISAGSWLKSGDPAAWESQEASDEGHFGPGVVWAGCCEPVRIYTTSGTVTFRDVPVRNAWIEPPDKHSRKPVRWMEQWIRKWTEPGDLIVDPYAGLGAVAEAVLRVGDRRYLGAEIDRDRHTQALCLLAQVRA